MSTELLMQPAGSDSSSRHVAHAAHALVDYRDGLATHLMWLAKDTAELSADEQTAIVARLLFVLGKSESMRRAAQIATLADACWGIFREIGAERIATVDTLRRVCVDTATAVRDELHRDSCLCAVTR